MLERLDAVGGSRRNRTLSVGLGNPLATIALDPCEAAASCECVAPEELRASEGKCWRGGIEPHPWFRGPVLVHQAACEHIWLDARSPKGRSRTLNQRINSAPAYQFAYLGMGWDPSAGAEVLMLVSALN